MWRHHADFVDFQRNRDFSREWISTGITEKLIGPQDNKHCWHKDFMRLLAIGDIHGFTEPLRVLLDEVAPTSSDTLIFLGDYVDKGPDVAGTLNLLVQLQSTINCVFLRGNHDQLLIDAFRHPDKVTMWECLAGENPLASYGSGRSEDVLKTIPDHHIEFLERECRDYFETDDFIFVHGGIRPHMDPRDEEIERLQWTTLSLAAPHLSGKTIICGHSSQESGRIVDLSHTICIDTGITKGQNITCLNLDTFSFLQVSTTLEVNSGILNARIAKAQPSPKAVVGNGGQSS